MGKKKTKQSTNANENTTPASTSQYNNGIVEDDPDFATISENLQTTAGIAANAAAQANITLVDTYELNRLMSSLGRFASIVEHPAASARQRRQY